MAVRYGWRVKALIFDGERKLSQWAEELLRSAEAERVAMAPDLLADLGEKGERAGAHRRHRDARRRPGAAQGR